MYHKCLVTRLPYEIASDILIRVCLPDIRALCDKDSCPEITAKPNCLLPTMLATICHNWRKLVFSIPKLWSSFSINAHKPDFSYINHRLQLSGPSPLFIRLQSPAEAIFPGFQSHDAMTLVKENLHRIAYLCLSFSGSYIDAFASVQGASPHNAPLLEELHIHAIDFWSRENALYFKLCTNRPRPRKVFISSSYHPNQVHLDWSYVSQMIYDHTYGFTPEEACRLISMAKSLVELKLSVSLGLATFRPGEMIIHNSIRKFALTGAITSTQTIFMYTTMPSLESLTSPCCGQTLNELSAFIQRSACPLTSLDLSFAFPVPATQLINALEHTPMLQELSLSIDFIRGEKHLAPFLNHLKSCSSDAQLPIILPHLQKFKYSGELDVLLGSFLEIMESRNVVLPSTQYQIQALQEVVIWAKSRWLWSDRGIPGTGRIRIVTQDDLQRILDLRMARQTISVSFLEDSRYNPVDLVEEAMEIYGFGRYAHKLDTLQLRGSVSP